MSNTKNKFVGIVEISDDEEKISPTKDTVPPKDTTEKPTEVNKNIKITVEQNQSNQNSTKVVIEIDDLPSSQEVAHADFKYFIENYKDENFTLEFLQLLELCIKYESSDGMIRILKRNLIPLYKATESSFKESLKFQKVLEKTIANLQQEPHHKFSCIKSVCEVMKLHKVKKRVGLVTLDNKVSERRKAQYNAEVQSKKRKVDIIDLDEIETTPSIIDVDAIVDDEVEIIGEEKENNVSNKETSGQQNDVDTQIEIVRKGKENHDISNKEIDIQDVEIISQENDNHKPKEIPGKSVPPQTPESRQKQLQIEAIEKEIEQMKLAIKAADEMEVEHDNLTSPYLVSHSLQTRLLELYKSLCELTGESPTHRKCRSIKLNVPEGQPEGPARTLEQYMNLQLLQADGEDPPFPDFEDVVKCVSRASVEDQLGWRKQKILATAQLLFTQIGMALQARRKRREWRDLSRRVTGAAKDPDQWRDPADDDPELLARLDANRLLALAKEDHLLDHYSKLETETKVNKRITILANKMNVARNNMYEETAKNNEVQPQKEYYLEFEVPVLEPAPQTAEGNEQLEIDTKPIIVPNHIDPDLEIEVSDSEDYSSTENEESDFELDDVIPKSPEATNNTVENNLDNTSATATKGNNLNNTDVEKHIKGCYIVVLKKPKLKSSESLIAEAENVPKGTQINPETATSDAAKIVSDTDKSIETTKEVTIKSEVAIKSDQEDETLKFLLEHQDEGCIIKTSFCDEPIVYIEISSSESESESEDDGDRETGDLETTEADDKNPGDN